MYISKKMILDEEVEFEHGVFTIIADDTKDLVRTFIRTGLADKKPKGERYYTVR